MKSIPWLIVVIAACLLIWGTLIQNRVQRKCVDIGDIGPGELTKVSLSISEMDPQEPRKTAMVECHSGVGGMQLLAAVNFALLVGTTILLTRKNRSAPNNRVEDIVANAPNPHP